MELLVLFQRAQAQFTDRVDAVGPGEWDDAALPGWTVADLVAHLTSEQLWVPPLLAGEPVDVVGPRSPRHRRTARRRSAHRLGDRRRRRAGRLGRARRARPHRAPAVRAGAAVDTLVEMTADLTVHAWDLARAIGGVTALDGELVAAAFRYAEEHLGDDGLPGLIAPPVDVPPGADLQTRLLARYGRRV